MASRNDPCPCGSGKKFKKCHGAAAIQPPRHVCYIVSLGVEDMTQAELEHWNKEGYLFPLLDTQGDARQFRTPQDAAGHVQRHHPGCPFLVKGVRP